MRSHRYGRGRFFISPDHTKAKHGFPDANWRKLINEYFSGPKQLFRYDELKDWDQFMKADPYFKDSRIKAGAAKSPPIPPGLVLLQEQVKMHLPPVG
jgi:hypothetical protein